MLDAEWPQPPATDQGAGRGEEGREETLVSHTYGLNQDQPLGQGLGNTLVINRSDADPHKAFGLSGLCDRCDVSGEGQAIPGEGQIVTNAGCVAGRHKTLNSEGSAFIRITDSNDSASSIGHLISIGKALAHRIGLHCESGHCAGNAINVSCALGDCGHLGKS